MSLHFGKRLRQERQRRHLSQEALAEALGASPRSIGRWEQGKAMPQAFVRLQISRFFGLRPDEFFPRQEEQPSLDPHWNVPFPRNPFFTGREEILQHLHDQLSQERSLALTQSLALSGLGGIGKTQIALEYIYRYHQAYRFVFWIAAETTESVMTSMQSIATLLQLPERQATEQYLMVEAVQQWLATHQGWLLVGDNVEDPDLLHMILPSLRQGTLLLTTRHQTLGSLAEPVELAPLSSEEGVALVLRRARQFTTANPDAHTFSMATELVTLLAGLPLALDQAGAYIEETGCSIADYLQRYHLRRQHVLARRGTHNGAHPDSVAITLRLSVEQVEREHAAAADLLRVCAFFHPEAIPEELLAAGASHLGPALCSVVTDPYQFDVALAALRNASLITRHAQTQSLSVHRLVQAVLQDQMEPAEASVWRARVVRAVNAAFPTGTFGTWPQCERSLAQVLACIPLIEQAEDYLSEGLELLTRAGSYLMWRGRFEEAETLLEQALALREQPRELDQPGLILLLAQRAELAWRQGKYGYAMRLLQRELTLAEQHLGSDHPQTAEALSNLATIYWNQGQYRQAEPLYLRALQIEEKHQHPDTAATLNNLALLYVKLGEDEQAEALYLRTMAIEEQQLGSDHPETALTFKNLASLYVSQGKYEQAESLYQRALRIQEQHVGSDHPDTAITLTGLATLYRDQEKCKQAESLYQRALRIQEQHVGSGHPDTAITCNSLAELYRNQGEEEQAERLYQRALRIREQELGLDHPDTAETLHDLAVLRERQGSPQEAMALYQRALTIREDALGPDHPKTQSTREHFSLLSQRS